jgi:rare lipoprotein A
MTASYYGYALAGLPTASGEPFNPEEYTAAHKSLPLGTELLVKHNDEAVKVTVNDRGPYIAGRELDLSVGAAQEIGLTGPGEDQVEVILL